MKIDLRYVLDEVWTTDRVTGGLPDTTFQSFWDSPRDGYVVRLLSWITPELAFAGQDRLIDLSLARSDRGMFEQIDRMIYGLRERQRSAVTVLTGVCSTLDSLEHA